MNALIKNKVNTLSRLLKSERSVAFQHNNLYYEVSEATNTGYVVNVYSSNEKDDDQQYLEANLVDGGLCTGSEREAIAFML